jgi:hypothetical protein
VCAGKFIQKLKGICWNIYSDIGRACAGKFIQKLKGKCWDFYSEITLLGAMASKAESHKLKPRKPGE